MISEQELFSGINASPVVSHAIYADIQLLVACYPSLRVSNCLFPGLSEKSVIISGPLSIKINGDDSIFPLSIVLSSSFPYTPPFCSISAPNGFKFNQMCALEPNGVINLQCIYRWIPRQSRLVLITYSILNYFSNNPPYSAKRAKTLVNSQDQMQKQMNAQVLHQKSRKLVDSLMKEYDQKMNECYQKKVKLQLLKDLLLTLKNVNTQMKDEISKLEHEKAGIKVVPLPEVFVNPILEQNSREKAQELAYKETIDAIKKEFHNGKITIDQCLKATREISRKYFDNHILQTFC